MSEQIYQEVHVSCMEPWMCIEHCTASTKPGKSLPFLAYWGKCTNTLACSVQAAHSWSHSASTMTQSLSTFVHMCVWYREILGEYLGEIQVAPAAGHTVRAGLRLSQSIHVRTHIRRTYARTAYVRPELELAAITAKQGSMTVMCT